jgi:hypothetical protein
LTIREWISSCRQYFTDISKARRDLIESKALDTASIWTRVWHAHLVWAVAGIRFQLRFSSSFVWHCLLIGYCRICDRAFGGTRYARYQEGQRREAERLRHKVAELKKQLEERKQRRFDEEMHYQALTNPHFVAMPHTHQDR